MINELTTSSTTAFEAFVKRPENTDRRFELINGEIIEVPSNAYSSKIAIAIAFALYGFVRANRLGHVTGEQAGYVIGNQVFAPDVAFITSQRLPELPTEGFTPIAPDLAVEVISPTDVQADIRRKLGFYAAANVLVWLVYPARRLVEVYAPDAPVMLVTLDEALDGGTVLPGFTLPLREIFD